MDGGLMFCVREADDSEVKAGWVDDAACRQAAAAVRINSEEAPVFS